MDELTKAVKELELQATEIKQAKERLAELETKYDKSKMIVAEQSREIKALKEKIKALEKELNLEKTLAEIKKILWARIDHSITRQWKSIKTVHEQMELLGQAQVETHRARTALGNKLEQANRMIHFLNNQTQEELAALNINNRTDAVLTVKKMLTLRNFVQTVERECQGMQAEVDNYKFKIEALQDKGLPSLLTSAGKLLTREQYATRMSNFISNQITASASTSEEAGPPSGQSLYNKLENLFYIAHEINHLFEVPPNFYRYTEADVTLTKIRRHQLPKEDWWQSMLQVLPY